VAPAVKLISENPRAVDRVRLAARYLAMQVAAIGEQNALTRLRLGGIDLADSQPMDRPAHFVPHP
jgi:hypothetical protein